MCFLRTAPRGSVAAGRAKIIRPCFLPCIFADFTELQNIPNSRWIAAPRSVPIPRTISLDAREIEEFDIHVTPTLIAVGTPLKAPRHRDAPLGLGSARTHPHGLVRLRYEDPIWLLRMAKATYGGLLKRPGKQETSLSRPFCSLQRRQILPILERGSDHIFEHSAFDDMQD
jgi:hypothetical protein